MLLGTQCNQLPERCCRLPTTINATKGGSLQWWLPQNKLRFTTAQTFWAAVELTAWREALGGPLAPIGSGADMNTFQILG